MEDQHQENAMVIQNLFLLGKGITRTRGTGGTGVQSTKYREIELEPGTEYLVVKMYSVSSPGAGCSF